ncbi:MAG TPA: type II secretion system F family protein [Candidatus Acidoferrales bacterium]|nr:type II secretion system F family protein [Candidatus Acidoferrales bacterium]
MNREILYLEVSVIAALVAVLGAIELIYSMQKAEYLRGHNLLRRLGYRGPSRAAAAHPPPRPPLASLSPLPPLRYLDRIIKQSGLPISRLLFLVVTVAVFVIASSIAATSSLSTLASTASALAASALPFLIVRYIRNRRMRAFNTQLPYLLDILRSALESGHPLIRGFQMGAESLPEPIASEVRIMLEEIQVGMTVPQALASFHDRVPDEDIGALVAAVRVQTDVGSSLAGILDHLTQSVRNRQRLARQIRTLTAQSRMSAIIVSLLPLVLLIAFEFIRPSYSWPLLHTPAGQRLLEFAIILDAAAFVIMRRLAIVEY